jgi:hypothetical protein
MSFARTFTKVMSVVAVILAVQWAVAGEQEKGARGARGGFGQGFGGGFGAMMVGGNKLNLLANESVQKELNLTDEQKEKIVKLRAEMRDASRPAGGRNYKDMSADEKKTAATEGRKKADETRKAAEGKLGDILNKDQAKRLDEISVQQSGTRALLDEKVQKELKLEPAQVEKIKAAYDDEQKEQVKLTEEMRGKGRDKDARTGMMEKREKLQKDTEAKVLGVLNKDQAEAFTKMKGKEFKIERPQGGPGGGGRRGAGAGAGKTST